MNPLHTRAFAGLVLAVALVSPHVSAQEPRAPQSPACVHPAPGTGGCALPDTLQQDVALAESLGSTLYMHDQAAWHSTDALLAARAFDGITHGAGWLTEARPDGLHVRYFARDAGTVTAVAQAVFDPETKRIVAASRLAPSQPLTERERRLLRARDRALATGQAGVCTDHPPNIVVLEGRKQATPIIQVFVMSAWVDRKAAPLGGYHLFELNEDGSRVLEHFSQTRSCLASDLTDPRIASLVLTHLTSATPTPFHVFLSLQYDKTITLATSQNRLLWRIDGRRVSLIDDHAGASSP